MVAGDGGTRGGGHGDRRGARLRARAGTDREVDAGKCDNIARGNGNSAEGGVGCCCGADDGAGQQRRRGANGGIVAGGIDDFHQLATAGIGGTTLARCKKGHRAAADGTGNTTVVICIDADGVVEHPIAADTGIFAECQYAVVGNVKCVHSGNPCAEVSKEKCIATGVCERAGRSDSAQRRVGRRGSGKTGADSPDGGRIAASARISSSIKLAVKNRHLPHVQQCSRRTDLRPSRRSNGTHIAHTTSGTAKPKLSAIVGHGRARIIGIGPIRKLGRGGDCARRIDDRHCAVDGDACRAGNTARVGDGGVVTCDYQELAVSRAREHSLRRRCAAGDHCIRAAIGYCNTLDQRPCWGEFIKKNTVASVYQDFRGSIADAIDYDIARRERSGLADPQSAEDDAE